MKKLLLILLIIPSFLSAQKSIYIVRKDSTSIMKRASIDGEKKALLAKDDIVLLKKIKGPQKKNDESWIKVETLNPPTVYKSSLKENYKNLEGYVKRKYLSELILNDTIEYSKILKIEEKYYYQNIKFTGFTKKDVKSLSSLGRTYLKFFLNGNLFNESVYAWMGPNGFNPCIIESTYYYKNGEIMSIGACKDCMISGSATYYSNGQIQSNSSGETYSRRRFKEEWYDNGQIKFEYSYAGQFEYFVGEGEQNEVSTSAIEKAKRIGVISGGYNAYNAGEVQMLNGKFLQMNWYHKNGKLSRISKSIDLDEYTGIAADGWSYWFFCNGKALSAEEIYTNNIEQCILIPDDKCWNLKGEEIICKSLNLN